MVLLTLFSLSAAPLPSALETKFYWVIDLYNYLTTPQISTKIHDEIYNITIRG